MNIRRDSAHYPAKLGQKFVDEPELWKQTEDMVRRVLVELNINFRGGGERGGVLRAQDRCAGLEHLRRSSRLRPTRWTSRCPNGSAWVIKIGTTRRRRPLCIHRAPLGTHERFIAFLIDHYAGQFPALACSRAGTGDDQSV